VLIVAFVLAELRVSKPMFDLSLFRTPTFTGGLVAAFTMNGSLFALYLYLVLYLQDILRYSALDTGVRLLVSTGALFVAAVVSGRLSERVPIGLLIMTGLSGTSSWTHLLPGLVVSGFGAGLVNPPLASTAIGVVAPERAGMASGVNSTARQVGFAAAIAAYGTIFLSAFRRHLDRTLAATPTLARRAHAIVAAVRQGSVSHILATTPPALRGPLESAIRAAFAHGIDDLAIVSGAVALVGALGAFALIRSKDFVHRQEPNAPPPKPPDGGEGVTSRPARAA
jgi:predicted MFS family arabinose efflux permease